MLRPVAPPPHRADAPDGLDGALAAAELQDLLHPVELAVERCSCGASASRHSPSRSRGLRSRPRAPRQVPAGRRSAGEDRSRPLPSVLATLRDRREILLRGAVGGDQGDAHLGRDSAQDLRGRHGRRVGIGDLGQPGRREPAAAPGVADAAGGRRPARRPYRPRRDPWRSPATRRSRPSGSPWRCRRAGDNRRGGRPHARRAARPAPHSRAGRRASRRCFSRPIRRLSPMRSGVPSSAELTPAQKPGWARQGKPPRHETVHRPS